MKSAQTRGVRHQGPFVSSYTLRALLPTAGAVRAAPPRLLRALAARACADARARRRRGRDRQRRFCKAGDGGAACSKKKKKSSKADHALSTLPFRLQASGSIGRRHSGPSAVQGEGSHALRRRRAGRMLHGGLLCAAHAPQRQRPQHLATYVVFDTYAWFIKTRLKSV
jgi:hypothetical protein